ncbi:MAG: hypothetical protein GX195_08065 [Firmicutes bacterium]|nr:hypothetical protein [Bacillota bacterium]
MKAMTKVLIGVLLVAVLSMNALAASGELTVYYGAMQDQMAPVTGKYFWTKIGRLSRTVIGN